jgi:hypothetical protein
MPLNKRRKYSNIKKFNDCCGTALHEATDKFLGDEGAVIRTGGEIDFIKSDPKEKIDKHTVRMVKYSRRKAISSNVQTGSKRQLGQSR